MPPEQEEVTTEEPSTPIENIAEELTEMTHDAMSGPVDATEDSVGAVFDDDGQIDENDEPLPAEATEPAAVEAAAEEEPKTDPVSEPDKEVVSAP